MEITDSNRKNKRFLATFANGEKIHFGQQGATTFVDSGDEKKRSAYLARHGAGREDWKTPYNAGSLSRWILWGPTAKLSANISFFKNKFRV
jgi:hypothetical protein